MGNQKSKKNAFWIVTVLLCFGMTAGGIAQLIKAKPNVDGMLSLGYPLYVLSILGVWKLLAVVAILIPRYTLLKEWAYAGLFFLLSGGVISHLASREEPINALPVFFFPCLTVASWYLRPAERRVCFTTK
ncbi:MULTISPECIES: DoxX family protein [unclassified Flavobacterium]|uniref:DoxX family protein n=1 Tax=unclassified Flavobacterium TaxID=196869 RepID=UPI001F12C308|nr:MULTISPECIES: DoxX family protein [unclassified Flavobacterium]UMY64828.1 DoxX family protein [Flavobacterium sp. HJ-32-4]